METLIRHSIRRNPTLYWLWLLAKYGYPHKLPDKRTDLHIDGFQRSGNTFSTTLMRRIYPEKKIVSHFHAVASLRLAINYNVPTMVVIRHPTEAIASSIVKRVIGRGQPRRRSIAFDLKGYSDYYRFVLENADRIEVMFFDKFISDPAILVSTAARLMNTDCPDQDAITQASVEVTDFLRSDDRTAALHSLGSPEKTALKEKVLSEIAEAPELKRAIDTFEMVRNRFS